MLYSKQYNFIFQKTKKTGSTSFEIAISAQLGPEDIITPVSELKLFGAIRHFESDTEEDSRQIVNSRQPQNYKSSLPYETWMALRQWVHFQKEKIKNQAFNRYKELPDQKTAKFKRNFLFHQHMTMSETLRALGPVATNSALKVAVIREPVAQAVSDYYDQLLRPENIKFRNFDEYLDKRVDLFFQKNWDKFSIGNEIWADKFIIYENYFEDIEKFSKTCGLDGNQIKQNMLKLKVHSLRDSKKHNFSPNIKQVARILDAAQKFQDLRESKNFSDYLF